MGVSAAHHGNDSSSGSCQRAHKQMEGQVELQAQRTKQVIFNAGARATAPDLDVTSHLVGVTHLEEFLRPCAHLPLLGDGHSPWEVD